ncbi:MAG TPA: bifunctional nuclease family protein [Myxococcota bacterium]|nr:bifunctional nuclease family protein [Myxococcota bacterium]
MKDPQDDSPMIEMFLHRIVFRGAADQQYIHLRERDGERAFPIVIGTSEAMEIHRVVSNQELVRPMTHKLAYTLIQALGHRILHVDITDLRDNTFHARLVLARDDGDRRIEIDSRPSDAIALALRAHCPIRVSESVLEQVRSDRAKDKLEEPDDEGEAEE